MKPLIIFLIICLIIYIFLQIKVRFLIYLDKDKKIKIDLYVLPKLDVKINLNKFIKKEKTDRNNINKLIKNIRMLLKEDSIIVKILKKSVIRKVNVIIYHNYFVFDSPSINVGLWCILSEIKLLVDNNTKKVVKEKYAVTYTNNKEDIYFLIDGLIRIFSLIVIGIKNYKHVIGGIKRGSSNKRAT